MGDTKIQWTGKTWNPIRARNKATGEVGWFCEHVTDGCRNCYAEKMNVNKYFGNGLAYKPASLDHLELFLDERILKQPLGWRKATKVFPCSMTDLFGRWVKDEWLDQIFTVIALATPHTFQILTKRADRMQSYMHRLGRSIEPLEKVARAIGYTFKFTSPIDGKDLGLLPWPIPNLWAGVSVEDQKTADERVPLLLQTPAAVRWISAEPLLGPIDLANLRSGTFNALDGIDFEDIGDIRDAGDLSKIDMPGLDWVVVGGESGPKSRPFDLAWARSIVQQCKAAHVPVFVKQLGANATGYITSASPEPASLNKNGWLKDKKGGDINEWPEDLRVREFPSEVRA